MTHGEYSGRGKPERITSPRTPVPQREAPASPAEISTVGEVVKEQLADAIAEVYERLTSRSTSQMKKETRPLKASILAILGAIITGGLWLKSELGAWQTSQREQWAIEARNAETMEAMAAHLSEAHVSPARIEAIEARLGHIEAKLGELLERTAKLEPAPTKRGR